MNINNLLKSSILVCIVMLCISNNTNEATEHKVNSAVFKHKVVIENGNASYIYKVPTKNTYAESKYDNEEDNKIREDNENEVIRNSRIVCEYPKVLVDSELVYPGLFRNLGQLYQACSDELAEYTVPKYNCIYNSNVYNPQDDAIIKRKFNELYRCITSHSKGDILTCLEEKVRAEFGNDYKLVKDPYYDVASYYNENIIEAIKRDGTKKYFKAKYLQASLDSLMKHSGLHKIREIDWNGIIIDPQNNEKFSLGELLFNKLKNATLIFTGEHGTICYDSFEHKIIVYERMSCKYVDVLFQDISDEDLIKKFTNIGLEIKGEYDAENKCVKQVFGQDFNLNYIMCE